MAQAKNVVPLPVEKLTFEAENFEGTKMVDKYDENRTYVDMCQSILSRSPEQLKAKVASLKCNPRLDGDNTIHSMIDDFFEVAKDYTALAALMKSAAARLTMVQHNLI